MFLWTGKMVVKWSHSICINTTKGYLLTVYNTYLGEFLMESKWCILTLLKAARTSLTWLIILVTTWDCSCMDEGASCIWLLARTSPPAESNSSSYKRWARKASSFKSMEKTLKYVSQSKNLLKHYPHRNQQLFKLNQKTINKNDHWRIMQGPVLYLKTSFLENL